MGASSCTIIIIIALAATIFVAFLVLAVYGAVHFYNVMRGDAGEGTRVNDETETDIETNSTVVIDQSAIKSPLPEKIGKNKVVSKLGQGNMGCVYKAKTPTGQIVAIKTMLRNIGGSDKMARRFSNEMQVMSLLKHPNIVQLIDTGTYEDMDYFVMEYVNGPSVDDLIKSGELAVSKTISIVKQVCQGLSCAHGNGIVHRDIKPGNIMLTLDGTAKIVDFGIAHANLDDFSHLTMASDVMGTPSFMSPEQHCSANVDHRSDIYSLGATFYQMLSGNLPGGVLRMDLIPDGLRQIIQKAMMAKPEERYANVLYMHEDLESFEKGSLVDKAQADLDAISENDKLRQVMIDMIYPKAAPTVKCAEMASFYLPAAGVGGNFYDYSTLPSGNVGILVGNSSERPNARTAIFHAILATAFRIAAAKTDSPGAALTETNAFMSREDMGVFAVMSYVVWNAAKHELAISSAGFRPAVILKGNGDFLDVENIGFGIGLDPESEFETMAIPLEKGDLVVLTSGGVSNMQNINGESFGDENIKRVLANSQNKNAEEIMDLLKYALAKFAAGMAQSDDATAIALKITE